MDLFNYKIKFNNDYLENLNLKPQLQQLYDYYKSKGYEDRILNLVKSVKSRLKKKIKCITFNTGTYRKAFNCSGSKDKNGRSFNIRTTKKFQEYFKLKGDIKALVKKLDATQDLKNL